jgi:hypothetical protein
VPFPIGLTLLALLAEDGNTTPSSRTLLVARAVPRCHRTGRTRLSYFATMRYSRPDNFVRGFLRHNVPLRHTAGSAYASLLAGYSRKINKINILNRPGRVWCARYSLNDTGQTPVTKSRHSGGAAAATSTAVVRYARQYANGESAARTCSRVAGRSRTGQCATVSRMLRRAREDRSGVVAWDAVVGQPAVKRAARHAEQPGSARAVAPSPVEDG